MIINKMIIILIFLFTSCAGGGIYYGLRGIGIDNYRSKSHYIYEDDSLTFAAMIRSGGITNKFWYDFLIINNGNNPISVNWFNDKLSLEYQGKTFQLEPLWAISDYPNALNPESEMKMGFTIERRFNASINSIERLKFRLNDKIFILEKNSNAIWQ